MSHLPVILTSTPRRDAPRDMLERSRGPTSNSLLQRLGGRIVYPDALACRPVKVLEVSGRLASAKPCGLGG